MSSKIAELRQKINEAAEKLDSLEKNTSNAMPLKITYFNIKARAEPIRLALAIGGIPFEDERLSKDQWMSLKPTTTFGQIPILTLENGEKISQSTAILRYVGKLSSPKLYPDDAYKAALVDQIISQVQDVEGALKPSGTIADPALKLEARQKLAVETFPVLFKDLDNFIAKHGGKFATGDQISVADLFLYQMNTSYAAGAYDGLYFKVSYS